MFHSPFHCPRLAHADRGTRLPDGSDFNMHTGKYYLLTITSVHQYTQTHLIIFNMCTLSTQCTFVHTEHLLNIKILVCTYFLKYAHIVHTVHIVLLLHLCAHCAHHAPLYYLFLVVCTNVHSKIQLCAHCAHCAYCAPFAPLCIMCTLCTLYIVSVCSVHRCTLQKPVICTPLCTRYGYFWHYVHTYILVV